MRHILSMSFALAWLGCPGGEDGQPPADVPAPLDWATGPGATDLQPDAPVTVKVDCSLGPGPGCTCVREPSDPARACWHTYGGRYADGGCSASYQCCGGSWTAGGGSCGACSCFDEHGESGCIPEATGVEVCFPTYAATVEPLPDVVQLRMIGSSYHDGCPVGFDDLSLVHLPTWGFDGVVHEGEMVVASAVAADVVEAFRRIYEARFPIRSMVLVDAYDGNDDASMADDNTSAFNCRFVEGTDVPSEHSYGTAIDLDPRENPFVRSRTISPAEGARFVDRDLREPGMIVSPGPVTAAFAAVGWGWGGSWSERKDYQHFSLSGN